VRFLEAVDIYFQGEKSLGVALVPIGLALLGFGLWLWRGYGSALGAAMGITLALAGLGASIGGAALYFQVQTRGEQLAQSRAPEATQPVDAELARMKKVNANWPRLKAAWTVLTALAIALLFLVKRDWVTGLCLAFIVLCAMLFVLDTFAERRARIYTDNLERMQ